jgi:hypothetical protein
VREVQVEVATEDTDKVLVIAGAAKACAAAKRINADENTAIAETRERFVILEIRFMKISVS